MKEELSSSFSSSSNLFPYDDIITKEIETWKSYGDCLRKQDRELFYEMLNSCYKYSSAINLKGKENSTESLFMTLIFEQYKKMKSNSNHNHYQQKLPS